MSKKQFPESWGECNLGDIFTFQNGYAFKSETFNENGDTYVIRISDLDFDGLNFTEARKIKYLPAFEPFLIKKDDLLLALTGYIGKIGRFTGQESALLNQRVGRVIIKSNSAVFLGYRDWLFRWLRPRMVELGKGGAQPNVSTKELEKIRIGLPPFKEQERLVLKIESSQSKIKTIEENVAKVEELIEKYRESLFLKAFRGKLVHQDPKDEPASNLLKKIQLEKEKLIAAKKIKKEKPVDQLNQDSDLFDLPKGWSFARLQQLSLQITDGEHATPERSDKGCLLLSARNVTNDGIKLDKVDYVPLKVFKKIRERCAPQKDDIFLSCSGSVGRVCLVDKDDEYSLVRSVALIKPFREYISSEYVCYAMQSPFLQDQIKRSSKSTAQANIFLGPISNLIIPIPPLAEQRRIVNRLNESLNQLEAINSRLLDKKNLLKKVKESILSSAFSGQLVPQVPSEGTGHELLTQIHSQVPPERVKSMKTKEKSLAKERK